MYSMLVHNNYVEFIIFCYNMSQSLQFLATTSRKVSHKHTHTHIYIHTYTHTCVKMLFAWAATCLTTIFLAKTFLQRFSLSLLLSPPANAAANGYSCVKVTKQLLQSTASAAE